MANLNNEFFEFLDNISINDSQENMLIQSRDALRGRIRNHFHDVLEKPIPSFYIQGSFKMKTTVQPLDGDYDLDDGIYFDQLGENKEEWPVPSTIHGWLVDATIDHTNTNPEDKQTCIRVHFKKGYHIDLPLYGKSGEVYYLAHKTKGWIQSDPKAFCEWFKTKIKDKEQLRRIVRVLKAWADFQEGIIGKIANGMILTVLTAENFVADDRDDIALNKTVAAIYSKIRFNVNAKNPVDDSEDLSSRLTETQKSNFQNCIKEFSEEADRAINEKSTEKASKIWRNSFGDRFPLIEEDNEQRKIDFAEIEARVIASQPIKPFY